MTRYVEAFSWTGSIQDFLAREVLERPLLNVCAGVTTWGDVLVDRYEVPVEQGSLLWIPRVRADWLALPFARDSFAAVFADPPWDAEYKGQVAAFMASALMVAPIAYLMAPWIYGAAWCELTRTFVRHMPGVNRAVCVTRYARKAP